MLTTMNKRSFILLILSILVIEVNAQRGGPVYHSAFEQEVIENYFNKTSVNVIDLQLIADKTVTIADADRYTATFNKMLNEAIQKRLKTDSDRKFLSWLFYRVHRQGLKNYQQYSSLAQVFENGNYDCLSATTLYALLLEKLHFPNEIIETNYHIYLKVNTTQGQFLIESTDPLNGFVSNEKEINNRLADYVLNNEGKGAEKRPTYRFSTRLNNAVGLDKLVGLQYYNEAVAEFNDKNYLASLHLLEKSTLFYYSGRTSEFGQLLVRALYEDNTIDETKKFGALSRIGQFISTDESVVTR
jgi:hypothetical protein